MYWHSQVGFTYEKPPLANISSLRILLKVMSGLLIVFYIPFIGILLVFVFFLMLVPLVNLLMVLITTAVLIPFVTAIFLVSDGG